MTAGKTYSGKQQQAEQVDQNVVTVLPKKLKEIYYTEKILDKKQSTRGTQNYVIIQISSAAGAPEYPTGLSEAM